MAGQQKQQLSTVAQPQTVLDQVQRGRKRKSHWDDVSQQPQPVLLVAQPQSVPDQATMHAWRLHVARLPPTTIVLSVASYSNDAMLTIGGNIDGRHVVSVHLNYMGKYALVET
ncbi:unnamed protein product [Microthlaspi erraticum]|uniref:Uncharacterized protein n=1 Tax=Microthlaspi erraticum TaxID=1685480 RepID=A0A6D2HE70_9BRAS|nr:unnamed protein product [Microthlaspi erraticum]